MQRLLTSNLGPFCLSLQMLRLQEFGEEGTLNPTNNAYFYCKKKIV